MKRMILILMLLPLLFGERIPVYLHGKKVGWEDVKIQGNCLQSQGDYRFIPMSFDLRVCYKKENGFPEEFFFQGVVRGVSQRIKAVLNGDRLIVKIWVEGQVISKSVKIQGPTLLLPNGPLSPYLLAARLVKERRLREVKVYIIPQVLLSSTVDFKDNLVVFSIGGQEIQVGRNFVSIPSQGFSLGTFKSPAQGSNYIRINGARPGMETFKEEGECLLVHRMQRLVVSGDMRWCPDKFQFKGKLFYGLFEFPSSFSVKSSDFLPVTHLNPFVSLIILQRAWSSLPEKFYLLQPPSYFYKKPLTLEAEKIRLSNDLFYLKIGAGRGFFVRLEDGKPVAMGDPVNMEFVKQEKLGLKTPSYSPIKGQQVYIDNLCGTFLRPKNPRAAVVFITGSGLQDRDENTPGPWGIKTYLFARISDYLFRYGIASLRTDDRGVGCSKGRIASLSTYVRDVISQVEWIRKKLPSTKVYLLGHSLGTLVALMASKDAKPDGLILLGAYGVKGKDIILWQVKDLLSHYRDSQYRLKAMEEERRILSHLLKGSLSDKERKILGGVGLRYLREFVEANPSLYVNNAPERVLIINGTKDRQTPPEFASKLAFSLRKRSHVDFLTIEGDHLFLPSPTGEVSLYGLLIYTGKVPNPELYKLIREWINGNKGTF